MIKYDLLFRNMLDCGRSKEDFEDVFNSSTELRKYMKDYEKICKFSDVELKKSLDELKSLALGVVYLSNNKDLLLVDARGQYVSVMGMLNYICSQGKARVSMQMFLTNYLSKELVLKFGVKIPYAKDENLGVCYKNIEDFTKDLADALLGNYARLGISKDLIRYFENYLYFDKSEYKSLREKYQSFNFVLAGAVLGLRVTDLYEIYKKYGCLFLYHEENFILFIDSSDDGITLSKNQMSALKESDVLANITDKVLEKFGCLDIF